MRFLPLLVAVAAALALFAGLGATPYSDFREARDAAVAREIIARREPITPRYAGEPRFEKPIAAYAPEALVALSGDQATAPFRSRALRAALAVALLALVASIGAGHFGARAGWLAALVLATTLGLPLSARTDGTQMLATLFGWIGCAGFADATFGRRAGRGARLLVAWAGVAAALVVAGPLPALWPLATVALYGALVRDRAVLGAVRPLAGLVFAAALALPWYGAMLDRHGLAFAAAAPFFPYAAEARAAWWTGLPLAAALFVVACFPWIALLPPSMAHAATWWRAARPALGRAATAAPPASDASPAAREAREEHAAHFFIAALLAALAPIVAYPGPPLPAALPALPAAALLVGRFLDHLFEDDARLARPFGRAVFTVGATGSVLAVACTVLATRLRDVAPELRLLGALTLLASWAPFLAAFVGRRRFAALLVALPVAVGAPVVALRLLPAMQETLSAWSVADAMNRASPPLAPLVLVEEPPPSLRLYLERNAVLADDVTAALTGWRAEDGLAYVAFRPLREQRVAAGAPGPLEILWRTPGLVLARVHPEGLP
uniref:Glycosyltransferase RgtA/B/C/D-like domain-containing protein n=1 Tax=Eiseniibacteriota bacterium TaxID=2212470 RepID=A0A832I8U5_UNCEI